MGGSSSGVYLPSWLDCSDLGRQIRTAKRREMWIFVGVGAAFAIVALSVLIAPWLIGTSDLTIVAIALLGIGCVFALLGSWGTLRAGYISGVRVERGGLRFRFLGRAESIASWQGIRLELAHLEIPAFPYLKERGAAMDASLMVWLGGKYVGQVPPSLADVMISEAKRHGLTAVESAGEFRGVAANRIVRIQ